MLNELNGKTSKVIHIMVTSLCDRNCKYCCNKQYDLNSIPYVTDSELKKCEIICITGGEPFAYSNPEAIAKFYKEKYKNIKFVFVYTNAFELLEYLKKYGFNLANIDGLNISIKSKKDVVAFDEMLDKFTQVKKIDFNRLYIFNNLYESNDEVNDCFIVYNREWQKDFVPAPDSIFRKV